MNCFTYNNFESIMKDGGLSPISLQSIFSTLTLKDKNIFSISNLKQGILYPPIKLFYSKRYNLNYFRKK